MKSTKIPNNTIGNRTQDLPACSAVPQPNSSLKKCKGKYRSGKTQMEKHERMYVVIQWF